MIRRWRLGLVAVVGVATACAGTVLAVAVNVLTGGTAGWFVVLGVGAHPLRWDGGSNGRRGADRTWCVGVTAVVRARTEGTDRGIPRAGIRRYAARWK